MKLTIFNTSSFLGKDNCDIIVDEFLKGFRKSSSNEAAVYKLNEFKNINDFLEIYKNSTDIIFILPVNNNLIPAGFKRFVESLESSIKQNNKNIGYIIIYSFNETVLDHPAEKYCKLLTSILKSNYMGTIIRTGCDTLYKGPKFIAIKVLSSINKSGERFGKIYKFDQKLIDDSLKPEIPEFIYKIIKPFIIKYLNNKYWDFLLKQNNAINQSFAKPY